MENKKNQIISIPYEIIRREDGAIALSCSAGLLSFAPVQVRIQNEDLILQDNSKVKSAKLKLVISDVLELLKRQGRLPFFESLRTGILQAHWLILGEDK